MSEASRIKNLRADIKRAFTQRLDECVDSTDTIITKICKEYSVGVSFVIAAVTDTILERRKGDKDVE